MAKILGEVVYISDKGHKFYNMEGVVTFISRKVNKLRLSNHMSVGQLWYTVRLTNNKVIKLYREQFKLRETNNGN